MEVQSRTSKIVAISPNVVVMRELRSGEALHMMIYVSEYSPTDRFIPFRVEYTTESELHKNMVVPIAIDISKFLIK